MMQRIAAFFADPKNGTWLISMFLTGVALARLWHADMASGERDEARLRNAVIACGLVLLAIFFQGTAK